MFLKNVANVMKLFFNGNDKTLFFTYHDSNCERQKEVFRSVEDLVMFIVNNYSRLTSFDRITLGDYDGVKLEVYFNEVGK